MRTIKEETPMNYNKEEIRQAYATKDKAVILDLVEQDWMDATEGVKVISRGMNHNGLYHVVLEGHVIADVSFWADDPKVIFWSRRDSKKAYADRKAANKKKAEAYKRARKEAIRLRDMGQLTAMMYEYGQEGGVFKTSLGEVSARGLIGKASATELARWDYNGRNGVCPIDEFGELVGPRKYTAEIKIRQRRPAGGLKDDRNLPEVAVLPW